MIICSCSVLSEARIVAAAAALAAEDPARPITPGRLFKALGVRPQCGTCFSVMRALVADAGFAFTCPEPIAGEAAADV